MDFIYYLAKSLATAAHFCIEIRQIIPIIVTWASKAVEIAD